MYAVQRAKSVNELRDPHRPEQLFSKQASRKQVKTESYDTGFMHVDSKHCLSTNSTPVCHKFPISGRERFQFRAAVNSFTGISCPLASMVDSMKLSTQKLSHISPERIWSEQHPTCTNVTDMSRDFTNVKSRHLVDLVIPGLTDVFYDLPTTMPEIVAPTNKIVKNALKFEAQSSRAQSQKYNRLHQVQEPHLQDLMYTPKYNRFDTIRNSYVEMRKMTPRK